MYFYANSVILEPDWTGKTHKRMEGRAHRYLQKSKKVCMWVVWRADFYGLRRIETHMIKGGQALKCSLSRRRPP